MHENRFFIRAGYPPAKAQGICCASAGFACFDGYVMHNACRSGCDGVPALVAAPDGWPYSLGTGSHVAPRERAALHPLAARLWHHPSSAKSSCQPSPRCALGDGRGGCLCGSIRRYWRNSRRTRSTRFHRDQAFGNARRRIGCPRLYLTQRRSRCAECGPRTLARHVTAVTNTSTRQQSARHTAMGSRPVPRTHPTTREMGGTI